MAAPDYATDLLDITESEVTTGFTAIGGGGAISAETDFFIQNNACLSKATAATWDNSGTPIGGALFNAGSGLTIPSPGGFFAWIYWWGPGVLDTFANGGARLTIGSATTAFDEWNVKGVDDWIFGGWEAAVVDPAAFSPDRTVGTPSGTRQYFGWEAKVLTAASIGKGNPYGLDVMRYGRGELRCTAGSVADGYATIIGAAAWDNNNVRRWGLMTPQNGAYFMHGLFVMGTAATAVDFNDSNRVIFVRNTRRVVSNFNGFEVRNASSVVVWTNVSVQALGTVSRGFFLVTAGTLTLDTCTFTDMDTFTFLASTSALNCTFRRTNAITAPGSDMTGSTIATPTVAADAGALVWNVSTNPDGLLDNMTFSKGTNAHHAIDFGTSVTGNITLRGCEFTGFGSTDDANDSTVRFLATTGSLTLSLVNCIVNGGAASPSNFSVDDAAGITVTLSIDPVTTLINIKDPDGNNEQNVRVYLEAADATGDLPYQQSITSITRSGSGPGSTATVTFAAAHGLQSNEYLKLYGITDVDNQSDLSGAFQVTVTGTTTLTYPTETTGPSPYNGTITGTGATIYGLTDASGNISSSRTYGSNQPLTGYARKTDDGVTYFKPIDLDDTVDSATGLTINRRLISDGLV